MRLCALVRLCACVLDPHCVCCADYAEDAEADSFFCFTALMSEIRDNFQKTLDQSELGVLAQIRQLNVLLRSKDAELWQDLEDKNMNPQFYSFRWLTLLLSQEFELPGVRGARCALCAVW